MIQMIWKKSPSLLMKVYYYYGFSAKYTKVKKKFDKYCLLEHKNLKNLCLQVLFLNTLEIALQAENN